MAENPSDLSLPMSVVSKIISEALPANINVSQETRKAIARAASVFVLYCTASAAGQASKRNRKTTTGADVLEGIEEMEFEQFLPTLRKSLETFKLNQSLKPKKPARSKKAGAEDNDDNEDETQISTENNSTNVSPTSKPKKASPLKDKDVITISDTD